MPLFLAFLSVLCASAAQVPELSEAFKQASQSMRTPAPPSEPEGEVVATLLDGRAKLIRQQPTAGPVDGIVPEGREPIRRYRTTLMSETLYLIPEEPGAAWEHKWTRDGPEFQGDTEDEVKQKVMAYFGKLVEELNTEHGMYIAVTLSFAIGENPVSEIADTTGP